MTMKEPSPAQPRRTGHHRLGGRSERVVRDVMRATVAELARVGYAALRVEDVAVQASVNKTTVYRRWPSKADLVAATLRGLRGPLEQPPDRGSVRAELLELLRASVEVMSTCEGQSLNRLMMAEMDHPEVASIIRALRIEHQVPWVAVIERAVARGELPSGSDPHLVVETIRAPVFAKLLKLREPVNDPYLEAVVNLVMLGAKSGGAICNSAG